MQKQKNIYDRGRERLKKLTCPILAQYLPHLDKCRLISTGSVHRLRTYKFFVSTLSISGDIENLRISAEFPVLKYIAKNSDVFAHPHLKYFAQNSAEIRKFSISQYHR